MGKLLRFILAICKECQQLSSRGGRNGKWHNVLFLVANESKFTFLSKGVTKQKSDRIALFMMGFLCVSVKINRLFHMNSE